MVAVAWTNAPMLARGESVGAEATIEATASKNITDRVTPVSHNGKRRFNLCANMNPIVRVRGAIARLRSLC